MYDDACISWPAFAVMRVQSLKISSSASGQFPSALQLRRDLGISAEVADGGELPTAAEQDLGGSRKTRRHKSLRATPSNGMARPPDRAYSDGTEKRSGRSW